MQFRVQFRNEFWAHNTQLIEKPARVAGSFFPEPQKLRQPRLSPYDNLSRLTGVDVPNDAFGEYDFFFDYDLLGWRTGAGHAGQNQLTLGYDALGRLTAEASAWFGTAVSSQYDAAGRRTRMTWRDGNYVDYIYDATGAMTAIRENGATTGPGLLATFAYDDRGRRISLTRGNGTVTAYRYDDPLSRLDQLTQQLAGTANDLTLGFAYNPASQIVSNTRSNDAYSYVHAYTDIGNAIDGLNRITATGGVGVGHDVRGNIDAIGSASYYYTHENQLASAPNGSFGYDPLGRLYFATAGPDLFDHDGATLIMERHGQTGAIQRRYVHGPGVDEPLVWYEGSGLTDRRWLHADERGSIIAASDSSGNLVGTINRYDEYGLPQGGTLTGRFGYTGQAWLPEAQLYYYRARIYNPTLGRFMQADPIGYWSGMNLYAYVGGDPVNRTDPFGLQGCEDICVTARGSEVDDDQDRGSGSMHGGLFGNGAIGTGSGAFEAALARHEQTQAEGEEEQNIVVQAPRILPPRIGPPPSLFVRPPVVPRPSVPFPRYPNRAPGPDWEWRGGPEGSWFNPRTGERLRPDLNHRPPIGPHWDYKAPDGHWYRWFGPGNLVPKSVVGEVA